MAARTIRGENRFIAESLSGCQDWTVALNIDHLIICVDDLEVAGSRVLEQHGLVSMPGGRHTGHGTANRIVPLGDSYLELVSVWDEDEAASSPFGRWVQARSDGRARVDALCLRTDDLESVCDRLSLTPVAMSRETPDGEILSWRLAGLTEALERSLPFFIQWEVPEHLLPGRTPVDHPVVVQGMSITLSGETSVIERWAGEVPALRLEPGVPGVTAHLQTSAGLFVL